jgi:sporulation protein YlmC with PRC-barrel domain
MEDRTMKRNIPLVLLLIAVMPILGACKGALAVGEQSAADADAGGVQLIGYEVDNPAGKWLGEVAGVLMEPETGDVSYVVLSYREPWVEGLALMVTNPQRFVPVPWVLFTPGPEEDTLSLDADEMNLIPAPCLEKAPNALNAEQAQAIDAYWQSVHGKGRQADFETAP